MTYWHFPVNGGTLMSGFPVIAGFGARIFRRTKICGALRDLIAATGIGRDFAGNGKTLPSRRARPSRRTFYPES
jgi:hypothetical protein